MLPWFNWNEIVNYAVSCDRRLCLVNKEWFKVSAGKFMCLEYDEYEKKLALSSWYNLAEKLNIRSYEHIDWNFIDTCQNIKVVELYLSKASEVDILKMKRIIFKPKVQSLVVRTLDADLDHYLELLAIICKQLTSLSIINSFQGQSKGEFLYLNYCNIKRLKISNENIPISFNLIKNHMPNIEDINIYESQIDFTLSTSNDNIFVNLKSLELACFYLNYNLDILDFFFPNLKRFYLSHAMLENKLSLIAQNMPALISLDISLKSNASVEILFPHEKMASLEELKIYFIGEIIEDSFKIEFGKLPNLRKFSTWSKLKPFNSDKNLQPHLNSMSFKLDSSIIDYALNQPNDIYEVEIDCHSKNHKFNQVAMLCKKVSKLSLKGIHGPKTINFLVPGPFKTVHMEIRESCISNELLYWLANEFNLESLTIYVDFLPSDLKPVHFPYLVELDIFHYSEIEQDRLKSIILYDKS